MDSKSGCSPQTRCFGYALKGEYWVDWDKDGTWLYVDAIMTYRNNNPDGFGWVIETYDKEYTMEKVVIRKKNGLFYITTNKELCMVGGERKCFARGVSPNL